MSFRHVLSRRAGLLVILLFAGSTAAASANLLLFPSALPRSVSMTVADTCQSLQRTEALDVLTTLGAAYAQASRTKDVANQKPVVDQRSGIATQPVRRGNDTYIAFTFHNTKKSISFGEFQSCVTVYGGPKNLLQTLGLYIPDAGVPVGSFIYTPRLGIYADPRLFHPASEHHD